MPPSRVQVLQLPLQGALARGGLAVVLKRLQGQDPRWLKAATGRDFLLDFSRVRAYPAEGCMLMNMYIFYAFICSRQSVPKNYAALFKMLSGACTVLQHFALRNMA